MRDISATSQVNSGVNLTAITQSSSNVTCSSFENFEGKNHSGIYNKNRPPLFKCGYLIDANFQGAIFDSPADFTGAKLTNANFQGAIINSPKFKGAEDFGSANFQGAILNNNTDICPPGAICNSPPPTPPQWPPTPPQWPPMPPQWPPTPPQWLPSQYFAMLRGDQRV